MKVILQIGVVFGVCLIGEAAACFLPFPFPASVLSMILEQFEFVKDSMWQLLLICLVTTLLTFGVTAAAVRFGVWLQKKLTGKEDS